MRLIPPLVFLILSIYVNNVSTEIVMAKTFGCTLEEALQNVREQALSSCQSDCESTLTSCTDTIVGTLGTCHLRRSYLRQSACGQTLIGGVNVCFNPDGSPAIPFPVSNLCVCTCSCDALGLDRLSSILDNIVPTNNDPIRITDDLMATPVGMGNLVDTPPPDLPNGSTEPFDSTATDGTSETDDRSLPATTLLRAFNSGTKVEWEIEIGSSLLEEINRMRDGFTGAMTVPATPPFDMESTTAKRGWSGADDSRDLLEPTTVYPWRTISDFGSCSGTLIGPRHVLTAAHCMNAQGTDNWFSITVIPGRNENADSNRRPFGDSRITLNFEPGDPFRWYYTPAQWRNPAISGYAASQYDWGILVLPDRIGELTGWMGYVAKPAGTLANLYHYNRGYPVCGRSNSPDDCVDGALYGDVKECELAQYNFIENGWNTVVRFNCDISGGHSGSPLYHYHNNGNNLVPVVSSVVVWEHCFTCDADDNFINTAKRLTPSDISIISFFRQWKP